MRDLCRLEEIPDRQGRGFTLERPGERIDILVVRWGGRAYAYVNSCPHVGTPLDWTPDRFMSHDGRHLQCATHGALFRVEDGACLEGPCRGRGLRPVPVRVEDGRVRAGWPED